MFVSGLCCVCFVLLFVRGFFSHLVGFFPLWFFPSWWVFPLGDPSLKIKFIIIMLIQLCWFLCVCSCCVCSCCCVCIDFWRALLPLTKLVVCAVVVCALTFGVLCCRLPQLVVVCALTFGVLCYCLPKFGYLLMAYACV